MKNLIISLLLLGGITQIGFSQKIDSFHFKNQPRIKAFSMQTSLINFDGYRRTFGIQFKGRLSKKYLLTLDIISGKSKETSVPSGVPIIFQVASLPFDISSENFYKNYSSTSLLIGKRVYQKKNKMIDLSIGGSSVSRTDLKSIEVIPGTEYQGWFAFLNTPDSYIPTYHTRQKLGLVIDSQGTINLGGVFYTYGGININTAAPQPLSVRIGMGIGF
jgi:hypothetical protein